MQQLACNNGADLDAAAVAGDMHCVLVGFRNFNPEQS